jgi:hypothetical protein
MKSNLIVGLLVSWMCSAAAHAQPQFEAPDQFYTNGVQVDGWTHDDVQEQMVSFWFGKNPQGSLSYRQLIAIVKDNNPGQILYYDLVARRFVGRYDMELEKYSLLPRQFRLGRLEDIQESMFPPPGEKPQVGELFDPPNDGPPSAEQLMMPPATMVFPRLRKSTWEGFYIDFGGNRRKMTMSLNGTRGEYRAREVDVRGDLTNVQYTSQEGMTIIRGNWGAGRRGNFEFRVMMSNLNEFQGEYWDQNGRRVGIWDAKRTSR